jgi:hypothetical protein
LRIVNDGQLSGKSAAIFAYAKQRKIGGWMATSLTLIFDRFGQHEDAILASNKLDFGYVDGSFYEALRPVALALPKGIEKNGELETLDAYGNPLTYVSAGLLAPRLAALLQKTAWSDGVTAFVGTLPPDMRVVLDWT